MGFSVTALQLVNRVHRRRRMQDVGAFSETEDLAALNSVNHAIDTVMSEDRWDFNIRTDGQLKLKGRISGAEIISTAGSSTVTIRRNDGLEPADAYGDYVLRVVPTGIAEYADTSFRAESTLGVIFGTLMYPSIGVGFPVTASASACELHYSEYTLPDTVDAVIRATHEEQELQLEQIDPRIGYAESFPKKHVEYGYPRMVSTGGFSVPTFDISGDDPGPSLRMDVWPIPDDDYIVNYSYYYRHPELINPTDTFVGVPPAVVNKIVEMASADMKAYYDKDYNALALGRDARASVRDIHDTHGGNRVARKPMRSWEGGSGRSGYRSPFAGKTLGP